MKKAPTTSLIIKYYTYLNLFEMYIKRFGWQVTISNDTQFLVAKLFNEPACPSHITSVTCFGVYCVFFMWYRG